MRQIIIVIFCIVGVFGQYGIPDEDDVQRSPKTLTLSILEERPRTAKTLDDDDVSTSHAWSNRMFTRVRIARSTPDSKNWSSPNYSRLSVPAGVNVNNQDKVQIQNPVFPRVNLHMKDDTLGTLHVQTLHAAREGTEKNEDLLTGVKASYTYTAIGEDGKLHTYTVYFKANENGFKAHGTHMPVPT